MQANKDCPLCLDEREDRPMHPYINLAVFFDGNSSTDPNEIIGTLRYLHEELTKLVDAGGVICARDGRHITYRPGDYDPWPLVEA